MGVEDPCPLQVHRKVQCGLATEGRQQRIWLFFGDDRLEHGHGKRLDIGGIREVRVGHDRGRVRVGQDDAVALLPKDSTGLGSGVIKLTGLPDDDRSRTDHQD